ncbi:MAG: hypothetical protein ACYSVY_29660, partial [Planctomycetota bacterium]
MPRVFASASTEYLSTAFTGVTAAPLSMGCWFYSESAGTDVVLSLSDTAAANDYWRTAVVTGTTKFAFTA